VNIEVGQIWQVCSSDFWTTDDCGNLKMEGRKARICLNRDEYIEIRYPFAWHFRTLDNQYFHAETIEILKKCRYIGKINEKVRFANKTELQEILDEKLYTAIWEDATDEH
jgi:hypothetical protein